MSRTSVVTVSVVCFSLLVLSGCTDPGPESSPSPVSPSVSTPMPTPSPSTSVPTDADVQNARRSIIEARRILDEVVVEGGDYSVPEELFDYTDKSGTWFAQQRENLVEARVLKLTVSGPAVVTADAVSSANSDKIEFYMCIDGSKTTVNFPEIGPKPGSISAGGVFVERRSGRWMVTDFVTDQPFQEVEECNAPR